MDDFDLPDLDGLSWDGYDMEFSPEDDFLLDASLIFHDVVADTATAGTLHGAANAAMYSDHLIRNLARDAEHVVRLVNPEAGDLQASVRAAFEEATTLPNPFV